MRRYVSPVFAVMLAFGLGGAAVAVASVGPTNDEPAPAPAAPSGTEAAPGGVQAPNARLAGHINSDGSFIIKKGIAAITHPSVGHFCITPGANTGISTATAIPEAVVDWSNSSGDANMVQIRSSGFGCAAGDIEVLTFSGEDGSFDFADTVAFYITVP